MHHRGPNREPASAAHPHRRRTASWSLAVALLLAWPAESGKAAGAAPSAAPLAAPLAAQSSALHAGDWVATGPADTGAALDLAVDPGNGDTLYLAAVRGLFVSRDGGTTWEPPTLPGLRAFTVSPRPPGRLYAVTLATGGPGSEDPGSTSPVTTLQLWRSDDQGRRWRRMAKLGDDAAAGTAPAESEAAADRPLSHEACCLAVDPGEPDVVVVAGHARAPGTAPPGSPVRGRLWLSRDGGATLEALPVPESFDAADLLFTRDGTLFAAGADGVFRSDDRGHTWQPARDGLEAPSAGSYLTVSRLAASAETPVLLYAGTDASAAHPVLYNSSDGGEHWQAAGGDLPAGGVTDLLLDRRDRRTLFVALTGSGVWGTRGGEWSALPALPDGAEPVALTLAGAAPGDLLVATAAGEVLRQAPPPPPCVDDATTLCLAGRFRVDLEWWSDDGLRGTGRAVPLTPTSGWFWSTTPDAPRLAVRVVNPSRVEAAAADDPWWIYWSALSDDGLDLRVFDTVGGGFRVYHQPPGTYTAGADGGSFPLVADHQDGQADGGLWLSSLPEGGCGDDSPDLCLWDGRFRVAVDWEDGGEHGAGVGDRLSPAAGWFRFSTTGDPELLVQVMDGRPVNGHWWVVFGGLTDAAYEVRVSDEASGRTVAYAVSAGEPTAHADRQAFGDE